MSKVINLLGLLKSAAPEDRGALLREHLDLMIRDVLDMRHEEPLAYDDQFVDIGLDSITAAGLKEVINKSLQNKFEIESTDIFDNPTINQLAVLIENIVDETDT